MTGTKNKTGLFDPAKSRDQEFKEKSTAAVRPKDASTLIIVRRDEGAPKILMGKRAAGHKFMPNKFVFPGGRVDPADSRIKVDKTLRSPIEKRLLNKMRGTPSEARAKGMALAAVRETFEETGLVIGHPTQEVRKTKNPEWQAYFNEGVTPNLTPMDFILRAITPPYRTRRFDTRFFMMEADHIQGDLHDTNRASGELLELHWLTVTDARDLDLPNITRVVLDEVEERLTLTKAQATKRAVPFVHFRPSGPIRETL